MAAVIVPIIIGTVASTVVTKITGNELLGAIAGGIAGGGLGWNPSSGWSWNLQNITGASLTGADAASAGADLINVAPGTEGLLDGVNLFDTAGQAAVQGMDLATTTGVGTQSIAKEGILSSVGEYFKPSQNIVSNGGGSLVGDVGKGAGVFDSVANGQTMSGVSYNSPSAAAAKVGQTQATGTTAAKTASAGQPATSGSQSVFDKVGGWVEKNPTLANMGMNAIQSAFSPDEEDIARAKAQAEAEAEADKLKAKAEFQRMGGTIGTVQNSLPQTFRDVRANSPLADMNPRYSTLSGANYQKLIAAIRSKYRPEVEGVA